MKQKKAKMSLEKKHNLTGWAFLIPAALLIFIFCFYPMIQAIILSFTKKGSGFAGLANYQRILKDKTFLYNPGACHVTSGTGAGTAFEQSED